MGDGLFGLRAWHERVTKFLAPTHCFVACGTWSEPSLSPIPVPTVNAGIPIGTDNNVWYSQLSMCAQAAAFAYALNRRNEWDLLALLDTDALIGAMDFDALIKEFLTREEILLAQSYGDGIGGPFFVWKHTGAVRLLHGRLRSSFVPVSKKKPQLPEEELRDLYNGVWWNSHPQFTTLRQDYGQTDPVRDNAAVLKWPMVRLPDPVIIDEYTRTQTPLAKPLIP